MIGNSIAFCRVSETVLGLGREQRNLNGRRLVEAAQIDVELSCVQRLDFLLDRVGATHLSKPLARWYATRPIRPTPLRPDLPAEGPHLDPCWHVLVNETVEVDQ